MQRPRLHPLWRAQWLHGRAGRLLAVVGVMTALLAFLTPAQAASAEGDTGSVMTITLDDLSPAVLPRKGSVTLSGTVTNTDTQTWSYLNLQAFASDTPITTEAGLRRAARTPVDAYLGPRIQTLGTFAQIPELAPGETQSFTISVPRKELSSIPVGRPGVYWIGVHALGTDPTGYRPGSAIGRARTFIAQLPRRTPTVRVALAFQLRHLVERAPDGSLSHESNWGVDLGVGGWLSRAAALATAAGARRINWLVDPSVVDAVTTLSQGNQGRALGLAPKPGQPAPATPSTSTTSATSDPVQAMAKQWLTTIAAGWRAASLYVLPYGDLDLDAAAVYDPSRYAEQRQRSGTSLLGLSAQPLIAPPTGRLSASTLENLPGDVPALLSSREVPGGPVTSVAGHRVFVSNSAAAVGGPGPDDPLSPVAMRQRVLAEAALRALHKQPEPVVVELPQDFLPASPASFFSGLDQPWLQLVSLTSVTDTPTELQLKDLRPVLDQYLPIDNFAAAADLRQVATLLDGLLADPAAIVAQISDQAATAVSYSARDFPHRARFSAGGAARLLKQELSSVSVTGPRSVTLSSDSGAFAVTVHNGLDAPILVHLEASTDGLLKVTAPTQAKRVAPGGRDTTVLRASTTRLGVHNVRVAVTDAAGHQIGVPFTLPVRSAQVSNLIWVIMAIGAVTLIVAIIMRNVRRLRGRSR